MTAPTAPDLAAYTAAVDAAYFGEPTARKTGRNPKWPYVPVIAYNVVPGGPLVPRTHVLVKRAFATRAEAVDYAAAVIARMRASHVAQLAEPRHRALREQYGFPRELA